MPRKPRLTLKRVEIYDKELADKPLVRCPSCGWIRTERVEDGASNTSWMACTKCNLPVGRWPEIKNSRWTESGEFDLLDPIPFAKLEKLLSTGQTNVVVLDLTGKPSPVKADAIAGTVEVPKKQRLHKPTKFEKALARFLAEHDVEFEEEAVVHLAIIAHSFNSLCTML